MKKWLKIFAKHIQGVKENIKIYMEVLLWYYDFKPNLVHQPCYQIIGIFPR